MADRSRPKIQKNGEAGFWRLITSGYQVPKSFSGSQVHLVCWGFNCGLYFIDVLSMSYRHMKYRNHDILSMSLWQ